MGRFIFRRLLFLLPVLFIVSLISFSLKIGRAHV